MRKLRITLLVVVIVCYCLAMYAVTRSQRDSSAARRSVSERILAECALRAGIVVRDGSYWIRYGGQFVKIDGDPREFCQ